MAKRKKERTVVSLNSLCDIAGVKYHRVYAYMKGTYNTLTHKEKTDLINAFYDDTSELFKKLGFHIEIKRIKDQAPDQK